MAKRRTNLHFYHTYDFWIFSVLFIATFLMLAIPIPILDWGITLFVSLAIAVLAKKKFIKETFGADDVLAVVFAAGIVGLIFFLLAFYSLATVSWWHLIALGILIDVVAVVTGIVPFIGDLFGAGITVVVGGILLYALVGFPAAIILLPIATIAVLIPGPIPLVTVTFVAAKALAVGIAAIF